MFTFLSNSQVLFKSRKHTLWFPQSFIRLSQYMVLHHLGVWMDLMEAKYALCGVAAQWWIYCMVSCCFHSRRLASVWSVSQSMSLLDKSTFFTFAAWYRYHVWSLFLPIMQWMLLHLAIHPLTHHPFVQMQLYNWVTRATATSLTKIAVDYPGLSLLVHSIHWHARYLDVHQWRTRIGFDP